MPLNHAKYIESLPHFTPSNMVVVGKFGRSVGLKGGIRATILTDFPEILASGNVFYVEYIDKLSSILSDPNKLDSNNTNNTQNKASLIATKHNPTQENTRAYLPLILKTFHSTKKVMEFKEIIRREEAELLCNMLFYSTLDDTRKLCTLEKDEFFYFDIIGMCVVEDGINLGIVKDIQEIANTHYLVLDKHFLIPYIDRYVLSVDLENRQIITKDARFLRMA